MIYLPLTQQTIDWLISEIFRRIDHADGCINFADEASYAWFELFSLRRLIKTAEMEFTTNINHLPMNGADSARREYQLIRQSIENGLKRAEKLFENAISGEKRKPSDEAQ